MTADATSTKVLNPGRGVKLLVLGGGYTGGRLAMHAARRGIGGAISHRRPDDAPSAPTGWQRLGFDSASGLIPGPDDLGEVTHIVSTIAPEADGRDPVLRALSPLLRTLQPTWVGYLSTTGVYGDSGGKWVDETTACRPQAGRSANRLACEQAWLDTGLPVQIFRLPAIYGPERSPFAALRQGQSRLLHRPGQIFCRVHVDDICGALLHCLALPAAERPGVVNVSDNAPCPSSEVLGYAAHLLDCPLPPLQRFEEAAAAMGPMARSFWSENRRVRNTLLTERLGYRLLYPTYREGLRASLAEEAGAAPAGEQPVLDDSGSTT